MIYVHHFHLPKNSCSVPVNFKGNISLLDTCFALFFTGFKQMEDQVAHSYVARKCLVGPKIGTACDMFPVFARTSGLLLGWPLDSNLFLKSRVFSDPNFLQRGQQQPRHDEPRRGGPFLGLGLDVEAFVLVR